MRTCRILFATRLGKNRSWWPSSLEHVSNSSRHALEDPDLNPRLGLQYRLLRSKNAPKLLPRHRPQRVQIMAGTEPLNKGGSSPHHKARK